MNARAFALARNAHCIFCGGVKLANSADHYPPKSFFSKKSWPEGYIFPACHECNQGSREHDRWAAFLSRLHPTSPLAHAHDSSKELLELHRALKYRYPHEIKFMFSAMGGAKKRLAERIGLSVHPGEPYKNIPILRIPNLAREAVDAVALKLTKALHFHHTNRIIPLSAGIKHKWYSNASLLEGKVPAEVFDIPDQWALPTRGNNDLSDQFQYKFAISPSGDLGMYSITFGFSICITSIVAFNSVLLEDEALETTM